MTSRTRRSQPPQQQATTFLRIALAAVMVWSWNPNTHSVHSWLPPQSLSTVSSIASSRVRSVTVTVPASASMATATATALWSSEKDDFGYDFEDDDDDDMAEARAPEDYTGKTIFQRTFYRLSPESQVQLPNAMMIEERLRFLPDPNDSEYMLPTGLRTLILREGTEEDDITDELFRVDVPSPTEVSSSSSSSSSSGGPSEKTHNGPRSLDMEIATILYLASNPKWIQGDVLELSCDGTTGASGVVGLLSCIASKLATMTPGERNDFKAQRQAQAAAETEDALALGGGQRKRDNFSLLVPEGVFHLTLSDESVESLRGAQELVQRHFKSSAASSGAASVSVEPVEWSHSTGRGKRGPQKTPQFRTILGSDLDLSFPTARELSKTVANSLLPSNQLAAPNMDEQRTGLDPTVPATFVHLSPEYRDETRYLRQFLEQGHLMAVRTNYVSMERLQFYFQSLPQGSPESDLDGLEELEVQEDTSRDYQSLTAVHSPDYAGEGLGEYFFPLETGAYEGGLSPF